MDPRQEQPKRLKPDTTAFVATGLSGSRRICALRGHVRILNTRLSTSEGTAAEHGPHTKETPGPQTLQR